MTAIGGYCCKSRKSNVSENLAKADVSTTQLPQCPLGPIRSSCSTFTFGKRSWNAGGSQRARMAEPAILYFQPTILPSETVAPPQCER
jgi:hypothetical protein